LNNDVPQYVAPPPDPGLAILRRKTSSSSTSRSRTARRASAALMTRYGTRTAQNGGINVAAARIGRLTWRTKPRPIRLSARPMTG
jgi:hypothetical protein